MPVDINYREPHAKNEIFFAGSMQKKLCFQSLKKHHVRSMVFNICFHNGCVSVRPSHCNIPIQYEAVCDIQKFRENIRKFSFHELVETLSEGF